jgi:hypothetical protein
MKMYDYSMLSHNRRKHQRWFNRYCRNVNKSIEDDNLWLGRFYISQERTHMEWFDDGSGGLMHALITMHDRKTGRTKTRWYDGLDMGWKFWCDFNNFIIEDCKVWEEVPDVRENRVDYRARKR